MKDGSKAPKGARNLAEVIVEFIEKNIIMETMGKSGMGWTPFLLSAFLFENLHATVVLVIHARKIANCR